MIYAFNRDTPKIDFYVVILGMGYPDSKFSKTILQDWKYDKYQCMSNGKGADTPKMLGSRKPVLSQHPANKLASRGS